MGLFGKIKNILFEDEDEVEEMPVYTKEEVKETTKRVEVEEPAPVVEEPIKTSDNSYFTNVKRDIDLSYDERDVLGDVTETKREVVEAPREVKEEVVAPKVEEKKSVFLSFDEEEFERLNSRITKNESRAKREVTGTSVSHNDARRANNNFSATTTVRDTRVDSNDRYKLGNTPKKTFTPSPIISPVYGILDKNYTKDDIVDKKGGMKREKVVKPIVKKEEPITIEQAEAKLVDTVEIDIDSVRKKAYGELEDLEKTLTKIETPKLKEEAPVQKKVEVETEPEVSVIDIPVEKVENTVEDELDTEFKVTDMPEDDVQEEVTEPVREVKRTEEKNIKDETPAKINPKILDDLEKTSTLQILDDIEKELNSIKPISRDIDVMDEEEEIPKNDTLEKDLFNLIDSMYVEGEEEEEDDYR